MNKNDYLEYIREHISNVLKFTKSEWEFLSKDLEYKEYKKGTVLLNHGDTANYTYFILEGYIRIFHIANNTEYTIDFGVPGKAIASLDSLINRVPSELSLECVTNTKVFRLPYKSMYEACTENILASNLTRRFIEISYFRRLKKEIQANTFDAEYRYNQLKNKYPELISNIAQKHIATYLGIKPESLSRIRKKILDKE